MAHKSETQGLLSQNLKIYRRRWYILFIFGLTRIFYLIAERGFSTIADTSEIIYNWDNSNIALITILLRLFSLITTYPIAIIMRKKGLRFTMISTLVIVLLGALCRCLPLDNEWYTYSVYLSSILIGAGGPTLKIAPTTLSSSWFPVHERTVATSIMMTLASFGEGLAFILLPALVPNHPCENQNFGTDLLNKQINCTEEEIKIGENAIKNLFYLEAIPLAVLLLVITLHFPNHPPSPPSETARIAEGEEQMAYKKGTIEDFKNCAKKLQFWILVIMMLFSATISYAWFDVLTIMLADLGISQTEAGYIAFAATIGSVIAIPIIGKIANIFPRHVKIILIIIKLLLTGFTITSVAMSLKFLPLNIPLLYICVIGIISMIASIYPIVFEVSCEITYPLPPVVSNGIMSTILSIFDVIFLSIFLIPNMTVNWMNWMLGGCMIFSIPLFFIFKPVYKRVN